jgi:hypothetical protein
MQIKKDQVDVLVVVTRCFFLLKPLYILSSHITKRTFKEVRITKRSLDQNHMETTEIEPVKNMPAVS